MSIISHYFRLRIWRNKAGLGVLVFVPSVLLLTMFYSFAESSEEAFRILSKGAGDNSLQIQQDLQTGFGAGAIICALSYLVIRMFRFPARFSTDSEKFLNSVPLSKRDLAFLGLIDSFFAFETCFTLLAIITPTYLWFMGNPLTLVLYVLPLTVAIEFFVIALSALAFRFHWIIRGVVGISVSVLLAMLYCLFISESTDQWGMWLRNTLHANTFYQGAQWLGAMLSGEMQAYLLPWNLGLYSVAAFSFLIAILTLDVPELGWASSPARLDGWKIFAGKIKEEIRKVRAFLIGPTRIVAAIVLAVLALGLERLWIGAELKSGGIALFSPLVFVAALYCGLGSRGAYSMYAFQRALPIPTTRIVFESLLPGMQVLIAAFLVKDALYFCIALYQGQPFFATVGQCLMLLIWILPFCVYCASAGLLAGLLCEKSWQNRRFKSSVVVFFLVLVQEVIFVAANLCFCFWANELPWAGLLMIAVVAPLYFFFASVLFDRIDMVGVSRKSRLEAVN